MSSTPNTSPLRLALWFGAAVWLLLLVVGFFAPGGWTWGMPGPIGHQQKFMIALWFVGLVAAPILAARDPLGRTPAVQLYLLSNLAILVATLRFDEFSWLSQGTLYVACALTALPVIATHPRRPTLWRG
jgi:hypothetical protein